MVMQTLPMERNSNSSFDKIISHLPFLRYIHLINMESRETNLHHYLRCTETFQRNPHVCYYAKMMMSDMGYMLSLDNDTLRRLSTLYTNYLKCTGTNTYMTSVWIISLSCWLETEQPLAHTQPICQKAKFASSLPFCSPLHFLFILLLS